MEKKKSYIVKIKSYIVAIIEWLKETWKSFRSWWFYNSEILGVLSVFIGGAFLLIFAIHSIIRYHEYHYDYRIKSGGTTYWVNENDIKIENGIITFKEDGNEVRLGTYELQDNRKLR